MVVDLLVIGTAITLGPLHNSAFILLLASRRGVRKGLVFLLSWLANLVAVVACVVLLTGGTPPDHHSTPSTAAIAAKLAIGAGLLLFGGYRLRQSPRPYRPPSWTARIDNASLGTAAALAWLVQPWALVGRRRRHSRRRRLVLPLRLAGPERLLPPGHPQPSGYGVVYRVGARFRPGSVARSADLARASSGPADRHPLAARRSLADGQQHLRTCCLSLFL